MGHAEPKRDPLTVIVPSGGRGTETGGRISGQTAVGREGHFCRALALRNKVEVILGLGLTAGPGPDDIALTPTSHLGAQPFNREHGWLLQRDQLDCMKHETGWMLLGNSVKSPWQGHIGSLVSLPSSQLQYDPVLYLNLANVPLCSEVSKGILFLAPVSSDMQLHSNPTDSGYVVTVDYNDC